MVSPFSGLPSARIPTLQLIRSPVKMPSEYSQHCQITIHARIRNFRINFKLAAILPSRRFYRFSLRLKHKNFIAGVNSESEPLFSIKHQRITLKSKFISYLKKIRTRFQEKGIRIASSGKKRAFRAQQATKLSDDRFWRLGPQELICLGSFAVFLVSLFHVLITRIIWV